MRALMLILFCAGIALAQGSGTGGPGGFPAWLGWGTDPDEQMAYANGDTLCVDSLVRAWKFTSPLATSYLSMDGDTLFFTSETDGDVYWTLVDSLGTAYEIYADMSEGWLQFPLSAFGNLVTPDDGGMVAIFDRDVTSTPADGTAQGVILRVDTVDVLSAGALADGAGSVDSVFVEFHGDVITESGHYGWTGSWVNAESDTVKVENGIIYDVVSP